MKIKDGDTPQSNMSLPKVGSGYESIALPKTGSGLPFPELPAKMVVAIDGWAQSGKNTSGELVAEQIGGVLIDSGRFYRAITKSCLESNVNLADAKAVVAWCKGMALDVRLAHEGGRVQEAQVSVNRRSYSKEELKLVGSQTPVLAAIREVREMVNSALRMRENLIRSGR